MAGAMSDHGHDGDGQSILKLPEYLVELCRDMRKKQTPAEKALWECLRGRRLFGLKFRRQHALGRYVADFYCHGASLVVELDGAVHEGERQREYDAVRNRELDARGLKVVRFGNDEVSRDLPAVLAVIAEQARSMEPADPLSWRAPLSPWERGRG